MSYSWKSYHLACAEHCWERAQKTTDAYWKEVFLQNSWRYLILWGEDDEA